MDKDVQTVNQLLGETNSTNDPDVQTVNKLLASNPTDVSQAQDKSGNQDFNGECEQFVEQMTTGKSGIFPTAADAWDYYAKSGQAQPLSQAKPGDLIYFSPDSTNNNQGHTGIIADTNGNFVSATYNGVQTNNLKDWVNLTGQTPLGIVPQGGTQ